MSRKGKILTSSMGGSKLMKPGSTIVPPKFLLEAKTNSSVAANLYTGFTLMKCYPKIPKI